MKQLLDNPRRTLRNFAFAIGLLPTTSIYTKFIILGRSRTGSNFLRSLLNSHPSVMVLGEIFRNQNTIDFDHPEFQTTKQIMKIYQSNPEKFLEKIVFRRIPAKYQALGFKLFYYHARENPFSRIWQAIRDQKEIRILHIKRKNILRTHLSRENALKTGQWVNTNGQEAHLHSYRLDYDALLEDFIQTRQWEQQAGSFFSTHPMIEIIYEDLSENTQEQIQKIQHFLNLPKYPFHAQTHKQIQKPLSEIIENYEELKIKFKNTEWASFFED